MLARVISSAFKPQRTRAAAGILFHTNSPPDTNATDVRIIFSSLKDDSVVEVKGKVGMSLLEVAHRNNIDLEGACEGSIACSTCHVILDNGIFNALPEATEDEDDMLDMAFGLTPTSRLGCQVLLDETMEGMTVKLPEATRNFYVDGHVPQPH